MAFVRSLWFFFALAVTLLFTTFVTGTSFIVNACAWRIRGHDSVALRRRYSAFMFRAARPIFAIFRTLMRIDAIFSFKGDPVAAPHQAIVVANHRSLLDIFLLMALLPKMGYRDARWVLKQELGRIPLIGHVCRGQGSAFVDRRDPPKAKLAIERAATFAHRDGASLMIFPEGTRFTGPLEGPAPDGGPAFRNLRPPHLSGFVAMRRLMPEHDVLVVTIDWGGVTAKTMWQLGRLLGCTIRIDVARHRGVPTDRTGEWLNARWREMDERLSTY